MAAEVRPVTACSLAALAAIFVAVDSILVRYLVTDLHASVIVFFRSLFGLIYILPWIMVNPSVLNSSFRIQHAIRAVLKMLSLVLFFMAIASATLADVTAIMFTTPLFVTLGAFVILKENLPLVRIAAVVTGFIGTLVILQPNQSELQLPLMLALAGAILTAIIQIMLKHMSKKDSTRTLVTWNLILIVPVSAIPLLWYWSQPSYWQLLILAAQGAIGVLNMSLITRAMSLAPASVVAPFDFIKLPAVAILAYLVYSEIPGIATAIGAALIFMSILMLAASTRTPKTGLETLPTIRL